MKCLSACFIASVAPLIAAVLTVVAVEDGEREASSGNDFVKLVSSGYLDAQEKPIVDGSHFGAVRADRLSLQQSAEGSFESIQVADEAASGWVSVSIDEQTTTTDLFASAQLRIIGVADVVEIPVDREYDADEAMLPAVFVFSDELELASAVSQRYRF